MLFYFWKDIFKMLVGFSVIDWKKFYLNKSIFIDIFFYVLFFGKNKKYFFKGIIVNQLELLGILVLFFDDFFLIFEFKVSLKGFRFRLGYGNYSVWVFNVVREGFVELSFFICIEGVYLEKVLGKEEIYGV